MRRFGFLACLLIGLLARPVPVRAGPLQDRRSEWRFSLSRTDCEGVYKDTQGNFTWSWILLEGYHQLGLTTSYYRTEFEGPPSTETDGTGIGPYYQFNFTPANDTATGFAVAQYEVIGGDLGDRFDSSYLVGVGLRTFAGNTASVVMLYSLERFQGANGLEDQDQTRFEVGLSLLTGRK